MLNPKAVAFCLSVVMLGSTTAGAASPPRVVGHADGTVRVALETRTVAFTPTVSAEAIREVKLLLHRSMGGHTYLVLDIMGPSVVPQNVTGMCGAGEERDIVWVKIGGKGEAVDSQSEVYESCR